VTTAQTTSLSRRAAMAASIAAFSLLPGAAKAASLAGHPDAELIELGRQLMPLFEEHAGRIVQPARPTLEGHVAEGAGNFADDGSRYRDDGPAQH
jgi:hypothetical protein